MRIDPLKQYAQLREQLLNERSTLEQRLAEINQVLGSEQSSRATGAIPQPSPAPIARKGRRGRWSASGISLREAMSRALSKRPLARKELVEAVQNEGYTFTSGNPLNSMGVFLYAKNSPFKKKDGRFYLPSGAQSDAAPTPKKKRVMSPEAREKIAAAQRARWARQRARR